MNTIPPSPCVVSQAHYHAATLLLPPPLIITSRGTKSIHNVFGFFKQNSLMAVKFSHLPPFALHSV